MKTPDILFALTFLFVSTSSAFSAEAFDSKMAEKANAYIGECNGPGMEPKPKMAEFVKYIGEHGLKDAKVECGISNLSGSAPVLMIHAADGSKYFVNFKNMGGRKVSEVVKDAATPEGMKRKVVWPVGKKGK